VAQEVAKICLTIGRAAQVVAQAISVVVGHLFLVGAKPHLVVVAVQASSQDLESQQPQH
jgi:hypothetical protein